MIILKNTLLFLLLLLIIYIICNRILEIYIEKIKTKFIQPLLTSGPEHTEKKGTPTMGGIGFILIFVSLILGYTLILELYHFETLELYLIQIIIIGYFFIGLTDDLNKIKFQQNEKGLSVKAKLILQFILAFIIMIISTKYLNNTNIKIHLLNITINFEYFYYLFIIFLILALTNATNLTDGLDGLLTTNVIITLGFLTLISYEQNNYQIFLANLFLITILFSFYKYNKNPAQIFMGDVGSLALGAYIAIISILLQLDFLILFFTIIYFIESLSVIVQVSYFKYTKKKLGEGKRIFLIAPYHHHLEKKGKTEKQIVNIFCLINIIFSCIGLIIYLI